MRTPGFPRTGGPRFSGEAARRPASLGRRLLPALLVIGATVLFGHTPLALHAAQLEAWLRYQPVEALVLESRLVGRPRDGVTHWHPEVIYRYAGAGGPFEARRFAWLAVTDVDAGRLAARLDHLRPGERTVAWVHPDDPKRVVLHPAPPTGEQWRAVAPQGLALLLGLLLALRALRSRSRW